MEVRGFEEDTTTIKLSVTDLNLYLLRVQWNLESQKVGNALSAEKHELMQQTKALLQQIDAACNQDS